MSWWTPIGTFLGTPRRIGKATLALATGAAAMAFCAAPRPASAENTTSQATSSQLNQLFLFETTNNKSAANEGYVSGQFAYFNFPRGVEQFRYQAQGQYSFTNQFALGGFVPVIHSDGLGHHTGFGDVDVYGQYKLDQLVPHDVVDLTAQLDVILPTGDRHEFRDTGRFGVRPLLQAYKDFGPCGPGRIGAYGEIGFTITSDSDFRFGLAGTYEWQRFVGILEFYDQAGGKMGRPFLTLTPGLSFRPGGFEFTVGLPFGLNDNSPQFGVIVKATWGW